MRQWQVTLAALAVLAVGCIGTEVGNPSMRPDGGVSGLVPVGAGYRVDAFFECLRFHNAADDAFIGLDYQLPAILYGEESSVKVEVRNNCEQTIRLVDWGTTDERLRVVLQPVELAPSQVSQLSIALRGAAPSGTFNQRIAVQLEDEKTEDIRVITFTSAMHATCSTLAGPSCRARPQCVWDDSTLGCSDRNQR